MSIEPFKIAISDDELDLLQQKLKLTRLPRHNFDWTEENGITTEWSEGILAFWLKEYDWRKEEARLNEYPQFTTTIKLDDTKFEALNIHFLHSLSTKSTSDDSQHQRIPLLFLHGWPGSFLEITRALPLLNSAGFDVIAPSLPGYGFSSYVRKRGFTIRQHAETVHKLMLRLGYTKYFVQGGDWGSHITHAIGLMYPDHVQGIHQNMLLTPDWRQDPELKSRENEYTTHERQLLDRSWEWFVKKNVDYSRIQASRPITLGHAMHDSPMGLLSWLSDKLFTWSDLSETSPFHWSPTEIITFTLLNYFPGPTTGFVMYTENNPPDNMIPGTWAQEYVRVPCGYSSFPKELIMVPRVWADRVGNCVFYREHPDAEEGGGGGHFAMYERPEVMVKDVKDFVGLVLGREL